METEQATTGVPADPARAAAILPPLGALEILAASREPFLFLDGDLRVRFVNAAAERHFGVPAARIYGRQPWEEWAGATATGAEAEYRRALDAQVEVRFSVRLDTGASVAHAEVTAYPAAGGVAVFVRDTTAEHRALAEAHEAATTLWEESAELAQRNAELVHANASLEFARHDADRARGRLEAVLDGIGEIAWWLDADGRLAGMNEAGRLQLARLGRPGDPVGESLWALLPPLAGTPVEAALRRAAAERRPVEVAGEFPGTGQWLEHRFVPVPDGTLLCLARDVSERHRQLELLRDSEARYRALTEAAAHVVWDANAEGQVTDMPAWRELTGQTPEAVRGSGWLDAVHPDDRAATRAMLDAALSAGAGFEGRFRLRLRHGGYRWYQARGGPVRDAAGVVREWVALVSEVDHLVRHEEGLRFLVGASATLAEARGERSTLDTLAALAVAHLADGAMITLVGEGGALEHVATLSRDGTTAAYAAETERMYPLPADAASGYTRAIRTGEAELVPAEAFRDDILPRIAVDATHLERLRRLDMYSAMVVPLVARGTTLGAMTLVLHGPERRRAFDERDLALAMELGRRAALALDNARLFEAEHLARDEAERAVEVTRRLQQITASFARTITVNEVAATTLSHGLAALSASAGTVYLLNEAGDALELVRREGLPDDALRPFQRIPLDTPVAVTHAVRTRTLVCLPTRAAMIEAFPGAVQAVERMAPEAWAAVPLVHDRKAIGAISLGFPAPTTFGERERVLLDALGNHCAQAMERARLMDAERDARDEAERANEAKSDLLAKVSHETRQPVHASIGWLDTLEMELHGPVTEAQREALRRIKQNQLRLLTVLNDLLDISRIEAGKLELHLRDVALADVTDSVESAVSPQIRARGITFRLEPIPVGLVVRADVDQLIGILTNLLSNAAKFTPEGGEITVSVTAPAGLVAIAVRDTGIGIPSHLLDRVFEPFFQVESGFTRTSVGTGLGLAISREAARAMGGELRVESELGRGSCFTVELRRA